MGTLASELGAFAERLTDAPRVYVDANLPAGLVRYMRERLAWDVFSVMEEDGLRRASDIEHFRLAMKLRRTLLTLDQDFLDDLRFPLAECAGVLILSAPRQEQFERLLTRVDRVLFPKSADTTSGSLERTRLPLLGRKLHVQADWTGELGPEARQPGPAPEME
jgi:predicted nuclease of predicted toxin-antitoxin system